MSSEQLSVNICKALSDKKAFDIVSVEVKAGAVADYFVICSGRSSTQVKALAENLEEIMERDGSFAVRKEGLSEGRWIAIDYTDVVVHIFVDEARRLYQLDKLWNNGNNVKVFQE